MGEVRSIRSAMRIIQSPRASSAARVRFAG
jgi:hypothetical protein